jgi:4-amino-4-deoxy-L-arabinose transferase-like glycosyltransferase
MQQAAGKTRRPVRPVTYAVFFLLFAALVFLSHLPFLSLPYFWDEAGQFIPAALDILRTGSWIPHSVVPNIHPPAVMAYLAAVWRLAGFHPASTRAAMLLLASCGLLATFLLAIELSRKARGSPAFLAVAFLSVSPLFFAQAMLVELDAPAMLFTTLALLLFLQDRIRLSAAVCLLLVLVKETGVVVPLVFAGWLVYERRWRDAAHFAAPVVFLALWIAGLTAKTGHWAGNVGFVRENIIYPTHPIQLTLNFLRRLYYLFVADLHWVGAIAMVYAWKTTPLFRSRSWRVAWLLVAAHIAMLTPLGGAALERYLLPVVPILYTAIAAALSFYRPAPQIACSLILMTGLAACNFLNPPYPFPYEDNLAFTDFVALQTEAAGYLQGLLPTARIDSVWPLTAELSNRDLGIVHRTFAVHTLPDESVETLQSLDWKGVDVLVLYSLTWDPPYNLMRLPPVVSFRERFMGAPAHASRDDLRARVPFPVTAHFERHGQWVDVFVNPAHW